MQAASSSLSPSCLLASARYSMWSCGRSGGMAVRQAQMSQAGKPSWRASCW